MTPTGRWIEVVQHPTGAFWAVRACATGKEPEEFAWYLSEKNAASRAKKEAGLANCGAYKVVGAGAWERLT